MNRVITLFYTLLLLSSSTYAFDGNRKGFVLGGGVGYAPYIHWEIADRNLSESGDSFTLDFRIGYAWNEKNLIVINSKACGYISKELSNTSIIQGTRGINWTHYINISDYNPHISLGLYYLDFKSEIDSISSNGFGLAIGCGIDITKHIDLDISFMRGRSSKLSYKYKHSTFLIEVIGIAF